MGGWTSLRMSRSRLKKGLAGLDRPGGMPGLCSSVCRVVGPLACGAPFLPSPHLSPRHRARGRSRRRLQSPLDGRSAAPPWQRDSARLGQVLLGRLVACRVLAPSASICDRVQDIPSLHVLQGDVPVQSVSLPSSTHRCRSHSRLTSICVMGAALGGSEVAARMATCRRAAAAWARGARAAAAGAAAMTMGVEPLPELRMRKTAAGCAAYGAAEAAGPARTPELDSFMAAGCALRCGHRCAAPLGTGGLSLQSFLAYYGLR
eukprot:353572-Chlamydomonas_euryale.AAC.5